MSRWQQNPRLLDEIPSNRIDGQGRYWTFTVHVAGHPIGAGSTPPAEPGYVTALECTGRAEPPSAAVVEQVKLAGRRAAALVHRAQLADYYERSLEQLHAAVLSNRRIGAAIGVLMQQRQLAYDKAFKLLVRTSQRSNVKVHALAESVLDGRKLSKVRPAKPRSVAPNDDKRSTESTCVVDFCTRRGETIAGKPTPWGAWEYQMCHQHQAEIAAGATIDDHPDGHTISVLPTS